MFRTFFEAYVSACEILEIDIQKFPFKITWIGPGNGCEIRSIVHCFDEWYPEQWHRNIMFHLIEVEHNIASALLEQEFFNQRPFIKVVWGDAFNHKFWTGTENSNVLYTTAISGPMFHRIIALYAKSNNIPIMISFDSNLKELVSRFYQDVCLRNCLFKGSGNSRTLALCYTLDISSVELIDLIALDKVDCFAKSLCTIYEILAGLGGRNKEDVVTHLHPTCGYYRTEPTKSILEILMTLKVTKEVDAAIISFKIGQLLYSKDYVESIVSKAKNICSTAKPIIDVGFYKDKDSIKNLKRMNQTGRSFFSQ
jgi:hypothetical protein